VVQTIIILESQERKRMLPRHLLPDNFIPARKERSLLRSFREKPGAAGLLPVFQLLKKYKRDQEGFELLAWGLEKFPDYIPVRVKYAQQLYEKGLLQESWNSLEGGCSRSLQANVLGQKLRFRLAILCGYESSAGTIFNQMQFNRQADREVLHLGKLLQVDGIRRAREEILLEFQGNSVDVVVPSHVETGQILAMHAPRAPGDRESTVRERFPSLVPETIAKDPAVAGFFVSRLSEVFTGCGDEEKGSKDSPIDSPTIAEIYMKQGHYNKALRVYRNLLAVSPGHEQWLLRVREIKEAMLEHEEPDLTPDPSLVHKWEIVRDLNKKSRFYNSILEKLQGMDIQV